MGFVECRREMERIDREMERLRLSKREIFVESLMEYLRVGGVPVEDGFYVLDKKVQSKLWKESRVVSDKKVSEMLQEYGVRVIYRKNEADDWNDMLICDRDGVEKKVEEMIGK